MMAKITIVLEEDADKIVFTATSTKEPQPGTLMHYLALGLQVAMPIITERATEAYHENKATKSENQVKPTTH